MYLLVAVRPTNSFAPDTVRLYWAGGPHTNGITWMSRGVEWTCYPTALITYYKYHLIFEKCRIKLPWTEASWFVFHWDIMYKLRLVNKCHIYKFKIHCEDANREDYINAFSRSEGGEIPHYTFVITDRPVCTKTRTK